MNDITQATNGKATDEVESVQYHPDALRFAQNLHDLQEENKNLRSAIIEQENLITLLQRDAHRLEGDLSRTSNQRDHFMRRLVELTTHYEIAHDAMTRARAIHQSAASSPPPGRPSRSESPNDGAAQIAARFAPEKAHGQIEGPKQ